MNQKIILAVDFGTVRIGLAISRASLAEPLTVIPNNDEALNQIAAICQAEHVEQLVVGLSENTMAELTKKFAEKLQTLTKLPLEFTDETLSSYEANQHLKQAGRTRPNQRPIVDSMAAAGFLQEYLDEHQS